MEGRRKERRNSLKIDSISPKYYAQECPVCNGFGTLKFGSKTCQGCQGKGYVLVPVGEKEWREYEKNIR